MEGLLLFIVIVLLLYVTGRLSPKNEARVKEAVARLKDLFSDKKHTK